jgi:putative MATE family efflux protein
MNIDDKTLSTRTSLRAKLAAARRSDYFQQTFSLALPITLQQLVFSSLNVIALLLVGQLGEVPVAAFGLANQVWFLLALFLFGINSGAAMFTAQFWGKGDRTAIRKVLGLALSLDVAAATAFLLVAQLAPQMALGFYSKDPAVVAVGSAYLSIASFSYIFAAISFGYASVLRSTGDVRIPIAINMSALGLNGLLSYLLIFGALGLPEMGVQGAGLAIVIARMLECAALLLYTYRRKLPAAVTLADYRLIRPAFAIPVLKPITPVMLNELFWALGITTYYAIYARISTESVAAMNIVSTMDGMAMVVFIGLGNATAIIIGNAIGAGEKERAHRYAGFSLAVAVTGGILVGMLILLFSGFILGFYKVPPDVILYTRRALLVLSCFVWLRACNIVMFIGVLRAGGDTRVAFLLDAVIIWVVGVPLAYIGAFVLDLPVYLVYLLVMSEELLKGAIAMARYGSRRWIHDLTSALG